MPVPLKAAKPRIGGCANDLQGESECAGILGYYEFGFAGEVGVKVVRILLLLVPVIAIYWAIRWFQKMPAEEAGGYIKKIGWILGILLLLLLAGTGKLNVLFAALGVAVAFLVRLMPAVLRYAPEFRRLWQLFGNAKPRQNQQNSYRSSGGAISKAEALEILGLKPGAGEKEIIDAHRKLISKLHPDRGGSDYLAAQINLAKKTLLADG